MTPSRAASSVRSVGDVARRADLSGRDHEDRDGSIERSPHLVRDPIGAAGGVVGQHDQHDVVDRSQRVLDLVDVGVDAGLDGVATKRDVVDDDIEILRTCDRRRTRSPRRPSALRRETRSGVGRSSQ